jgi:hypothetical protein
MDDIKNIDHIKRIKVVDGIDIEPINKNNINIVDDIRSNNKIKAGLGNFMLSLTEKILIKTICFLLLILLAVQILFLIPGMGPRLNLALRMEGEPIKEENAIYQAGNVATTPWTSLTLKLMEYKERPDVVVEVNGQEVNSFIKNEITLAVSKGDIITVINSGKNLPVKVMVSKKTSNILMPNLNTAVKGTGRLYFEPVVTK